MIKSQIKRRTYGAIYRLLNRVSPLDFDCGRLCREACCRTERKEVSPGETSEMGIYLLPGEDKIHDKGDSWLKWTVEEAQDYDFPESWKGKIFFVQCGGPENCNRRMRPMQCRTFPLTPHIEENGELTLIYNDMILPYRCPLIDDEMPLNEGFIQATFTVWRHLLEDPLIYDLVKSDSISRVEAEKELREKLLL